MKIRLTELVTSFLIFLFVYAALSKWWQFPQFIAQLGQSPLLTKFARPVAIGIPLLELIIAAGLATQRFQLRCQYASFFLMTMFSAYIVAITRFSEYIPCSCGGVLERMNWNQHLVFNLLVVLLTAVVIYREESRRNIISTTV